VVPVVPVGILAMARVPETMSDAASARSALSWVSVRFTQWPLLYWMASSPAAPVMADRSSSAAEVPCLPARAEVVAAASALAARSVTRLTVSASGIWP